MLTPEVIQWAVYAGFIAIGWFIRHKFGPSAPVPTPPAMPPSLPSIPALGNHPALDHLLLALVAEAKGDQATMESEILLAVQAAAQKLQKLPQLPAPTK